MHPNWSRNIFRLSRVSTLPVALFVALSNAIPVSTLRAQSASFSGAVLIDPTDKPLANAEITFPELKLTTKSDKSGNFSITGLPAGKHQVVVRVVGYEPFIADITFGASQKVEADVSMIAVTTKLATVAVNDTMRRADLRLVEFEERRATPGIGRFLTADVFAKASGSRITDILLGRIPGVKRINLATTSVQPLATTRGGQGGALLKGTANKSCFIQIVVNGTIVYNMASTEFYDIDRLNAADVLGAEFYTVATTPLKYNGTGANCGTIIIWTK